MDFDVHGTPFSTVSSAELLTYGAIDGETLNSGGFWRIFTSQLLHSKQAHMTFNVIFGYVLGLVIEQRLGSFRFATIYWLRGALGILASVLYYPEYVSSGSSQALMGLFASILILWWRGFIIQKWALRAAVLGLTLQLSLDIYVNHFPKAGHVVGFIAGGAVCWIFMVARSKVTSLS